MICDRCGLELLDKSDQNLALEGQWAWEKAVKDNGGKPRGLVPCMNYIRCRGEIILVDTNPIARCIYRFNRLFGRMIKAPRRRQKR